MNRRQFLMAGISALSVTCVGWVAVALRRKDAVTPSPGVFSPTSEPAVQTQQAAIPEPTSFQPAATVPQAAPVLLESPVCTAAAQTPIPRADWGAREPAVTPDGWGENGPYSAANPDGWLVYEQPLAEVYHTIVVHHSALPLSDGPKEIQNLHMDEKGFADVGYHYLIDETGRLYQGRSIEVRGAHTYAHNFGAVGICLIGNFEAIQPAQAQIEMLQALVACLVGGLPNVTRLAGHGDLNPGITLCPGENLAPFLPRIAEQFGLQFGA